MNLITISIEYTLIRGWEEICVNKSLLVKQLGNVAQVVLEVVVVGNDGMKNKR